MATEETNLSFDDDLAQALEHSVSEQSADAEEVQDVHDGDAAVQEPVEVEEVPVQEVDVAVAEQADAEPSANAAEQGDGEYRARLRKFTRELKKQPGSWYIIQCYAGYENKVKTNLDMRIQNLEVEDSIYEAVVPVQQESVIKDGKRKLVKTKLLPGYVLVRMDINDRAWSVVRETPGVTSFVGNEGNATAVKHRDVAKFLMPQEVTETGAPKTDPEGDQVVAMPSDAITPTSNIDYEEGEAVTILTGAFAGVSATISSIDHTTGKIQALVSIFGRETPVEITANEIEKIM